MIDLLSLRAAKQSICFLLPRRFSVCKVLKTTSQQELLHNHDTYSNLYWRGFQQVSRKINIVPNFA